jgi:hypothetical protein
MKISLLRVPSLSIRKKYLLLREIVIILSLLEWIGGGGFLYSLGAEEGFQSVVFFILLAISFYSSSKLAYLTSELLIRMATGEK